MSTKLKNSRHKKGCFSMQKQNLSICTYKGACYHKWCNNFRKHKMFVASHQLSNDVYAHESNKKNQNSRVLKRHIIYSSSDVQQTDSEEYFAFCMLHHIIEYCVDRKQNARSDNWYGYHWDFPLANEQLHYP